MQRKVITTAAALGLSASLIVAPVDAAEVGPKMGAYNSCFLTLTDQEYGALVDSIGYVSAEDITSGAFGPIETVYPSFKQLRSDLEAELAALRKENLESSERKARRDKLQEKFVQKATATMPNYVADLAVKLTLFLEGIENGKNYAEIFPPSKRTEIKVEGDAYSFVEKPFAVEVEELVSNGVPRQEAQALVSEYRQSKLYKAESARAKVYAPYYKKAQEACAAGGDRTVDFPTTVTRPGEDTPSADAGKVAGIVVGVIAVLAAVVGAVAFLLPQLGFMLPF